MWKDLAHHYYLVVEFRIFDWPRRRHLGQIGGAFDKLLVFVDQKYHTWDSFGAKTQKGDYKDQNPNLRFFCA